MVRIRLKYCRLSVTPIYLFNGQPDRLWLHQQMFAEHRYHIYRLIWFNESNRTFASYGYDAHVSTPLLSLIYLYEYSIEPPSQPLLPERKFPDYILDLIHATFFFSFSDSLASNILWTQNFKITLLTPFLSHFLKFFTVITRYK